MYQGVGTACHSQKLIKLDASQRILSCGFSLKAILKGIHNFETKSVLGPAESLFEQWRCGVVFRHVHVAGDAGLLGQVHRAVGTLALPRPDGFPWERHGETVLPPFFNGETRPKGTPELQHLVSG